MGVHNDIVASEAFKPGFLAKTTMARNAQDAAIATTIQALQWQTAKHGRRLIPVNPADTTQSCSNCGEIANPPLKLEDRIYRCRHCGMIRDRDKNAARNMLIGAGLVPVADRAVSRLSTAQPKTQAPPRPRIPRL